MNFQTCQLLYREVTLEDQREKRPTPRPWHGLAEVLLDQKMAGRVGCRIYFEPGGAGVSYHGLQPSPCCHQNRETKERPKGQNVLALVHAL